MVFSYFMLVFVQFYVILIVLAPMSVMHSTMKQILVWSGRDRPTFAYSLEIYHDKLCPDFSDDIAALTLKYLKIFGGVMHGTMKLMVIKLPLYVASLDHCDLTHCPLVTSCDVIEQVQHDSVNGLFCDFEQQVITWNNFDLISCAAFIWSTKHIYTFQNYSKLQSQHTGTMPLTKVVSRLSPMSITFPLFGGRALQVPKHLTRFHCPFGNMLTR